METFDQGRPCSIVQKADSLGGVESQGRNRRAHQTLQELKPGRGISLTEETRNHGLYESGIADLVRNDLGRRVEGMFVVRLVHFFRFGDPHTRLVSANGEQCPDHLPGASATLPARVQPISP